MAENTNHTDFAGLLKGFADKDGNIPAASIGPAATAIKTAIGNEFVDKTRYNAKLAEIRRLNEEMQTAEDNAATAPDWKKRFEDEHAAFEQFKGDIEAEKTLTAKQDAYREMLKDSGIAAEYHEKVLKYADLDGVELDGKGHIKSAAKLMQAIREEWPMFVETTQEGSTVNTPNPPGNGGSSKLTRDDIMKIQDAGERQKAISENLELFGVS